MLRTIHVKEALKLEDTIFIDVRSQSEFKEATIPGAVNIPILDDKERERVGTVYRQESKEKANFLGLEYIAKKLPTIYAQILEYKNTHRNIVIFCWRGGMRSKSICTVLNMMHLPNVYQLLGGYKSYRKYINDFFKTSIKQYKFIMIHGLTGVGKTYILEQLQELGEPVLDLEKLANNSGSVFGNIIYEKLPPSQKMFESYVFEILYKNPKKYIFVESESKRIGNIQVPEIIYEQMTSGYHILINTTLENRIKIILKDYIIDGDNKDKKIVKAIQNLKKRIGNEMVEILLQKISIKDYEYVVKYLILNYYDPLYKYSIEKYEPYDLVKSYENIDDVVCQVLHFAKSIGRS